MLKRLSTALLISSALVTAVSASENSTIKQVRLSSGGLAEITTTAKLGDSSNVRFNVPIEQVDDVLKSLMLVGSAGHIKNLSLAGPQQLEESLKDTSFDIQALSSLPSLIGSIQGTPVTASSNGKTVKGRVLSVEQRKRPDDTDQFILSVLNEQNAVEALTLENDTSLTIEDADKRAQLGRASDAVARSKNDKQRTINAAIQGATNDTLDLSYVVAAPIWKATYKIVTDANGKARLQVWAVLENASGSDWKDVKLTLASAEPVTLKQRLHQIYWRDRHEVPVNVAAGNIPDVDTGELGNRAIADEAAPQAADRKAKSMMAEFAARPAPAAAPVEETAAGAGSEPPTSISTERDTSAVFEISDPITLANGDTLSVPIVDATIDAEILSVYRSGNSSVHPVAALMLTNNTGVSLPAGILTAYDKQDGYIGDAQLSGLPKDDTRFAGFTTDQKVSVTEDRKPTRQMVSIKVADGVLQSTVKLATTTTYTISGALDGDRTVIVEHPILSGWTTTSDALDGKTATHHRLKTAVPKGTEKTVSVVDEQLQHEAFSLSDADPDVLISWASSTTNKALADKLKQIADIRSKQTDAQGELDNIQSQLDDISGTQERIRQNITAVPENSDLKKRYLVQLEETEDAIADLTTKKSETKGEVTRLQNEISQIIKSL